MRCLVLLFVLSVSGNYVSDNYWNDYGDIHRKIYENFGISNHGWERSRKHWLRYDDGHRYDLEKGVSLGYDYKYPMELRVIDDKDTDKENIIRPCHLQDLQCIRKVFASNSQCSPSYGLPDPLYLARNTLYIPFTNMTITLTDVKITGLGSANVRDFYVNKKTGNLVFAITVKNLNETTKKTFFTYRRTAQESIVLADFTTIEIASLTFTAIIPKTHEGLKLDQGEFHVFIDDALPKFVFGPKLYDSTDPQVIAAYTSLITNIPTVVRESFLFQSQLLTAIYIQKNICDFGVKLITV